MTATTTTATFEEVSSSYKSLLSKLRTITHVNHAASVLNYDRQVFMAQSDRSAASRGKQMAALASVAHEKSTSKELGELIDKSLKELNELLADGGGGDGGKCGSEDLMTAKRLLELEEDAYRKATCIPMELAGRKAQLEASANHAWVKVREGIQYYPHNCWPSVISVHSNYPRHKLFNNLRAGAREQRLFLLRAIPQRLL